MVSVAGVGGLHGYDPFQMAGYPAGLWNSMGKKGFELAQWMFPGLSFERRFYLILLTAGLIFPVIFGVWCAQFFSSRMGRLLWAFTLLLFWHFETYIAYFWQVGNVFFPAGSLLMAMLLVTCWQLSFGEVSWRTALGVGVGGALLFYVHTVLMVPLTVSAAGFAIASIWKKQWSLRRTGFIILAGVLFSGLVLPWLIPLLLTRDISVPAPWPMFTGGIRNLIMDLFSDRVYQHPFDRRFLFQAAILFGMVGSWIVLKSKVLLLGKLKALIVGAFVCLGIVYGLPLTGAFAAIQPYRFLIPLVVCLLPLATLGVQGFVGWWWRLGGQSRSWAALPVVLLLPHLTAYFVDVTAKPRVVSSSNYTAALDRMTQLPGKGRVFLDDIPLGHLAPYFTGKPILGGLSTQAFVANGFAGIDDRGILFGRPADQWTVDALSGYFDLYAVEYLVLQRADLIKLVKQDRALFEYLGNVGKWQFFRYRPYQGYDMGGDARVSATCNEIVVERGSANEVLLKFHASRFLKSVTPGFVIEPFDVNGVPVPFVRGVFADGVQQGVLRQ